MMLYFLPEKCRSKLVKNAFFFYRMMSIASCHCSPQPPPPQPRQRTWRGPKWRSRCPAPWLQSFWQSWARGRHDRKWSSSCHSATRSGCRSERSFGNIHGLGNCCSSAPSHCPAAGMMMRRPSSDGGCHQHLSIHLDLLHHVPGLGLLLLHLLGHLLSSMTW